MKIVKKEIEDYDNRRWNIIVKDQNEVSSDTNSKNYVAYLSKYVNPKNENIMRIWSIA